MFGRFSSWLACRLLRLSVLSETDRVKLSRVILDELGALPLKEIIETKDGILHVNGKAADMEMIRKLRNSAKSTLNSYALNFIHTQVLFEAVKLGVHTVETERQVVFARAAIWFSQQEKRFLTLLAGEENISE